MAPHMSRRRASIMGLFTPIIATVLFAVNAHALFWNKQNRDRVAKFEPIPASIAMLGQAELQHLQSNAQAETVLDKLFGTDCYSDALRQVGNECSRLSSEQKNRLAFILSACHMRQLGQHSPSCKPGMSLKQCTDALDDRGYATYLKFLTDIDSMCLFIQSQDFQQHTEHMLNVLYGGSRFATEALVNATTALEAQKRRLSDLGSHLSELQDLQAQVAQDVERGLQEVRGLQQQAAQLGAQMQATIALEAAILARQAVSIENMKEHEIEEGKRASEASSRWEVAEAHAVALLQEQTQYREMQQHLLSDLRELQANSNGLRESLAAVLAYAQRSDAVLVRLLGRSYSLDDVIFYGAGALGVLTAGVMPGLRAARVPLAGLFAGNLALERASLGQLGSILHVDDLGQVALPLPWLGASSWSQFSLKWALRRLCLGLALLLLVRSGIAHRGHERESLRELQSIQRLMHEAEHRQQEAHQQLRLQILADMDRLSREIGETLDPKTLPSGRQPGQQRETSWQALEVAPALPKSAFLDLANEDRANDDRRIEGQADLATGRRVLNCAEGEPGQGNPETAGSMPSVQPHMHRQQMRKRLLGDTTKGVSTQSTREKSVRSAEHEGAVGMQTDECQAASGSTSKPTPALPPDKRRLDIAGTPDAREVKRKRARAA